MTHLDNLEDCPLDRKAPFGITGVRQTQFSVARHYGGLRAYGFNYVYIPTTDELIRADVLAWKKTRDAEAKPKPSLHPYLFQ